MFVRQAHKGESQEDKTDTVEMSCLPSPDLVKPSIQCGQQDGQKTHDAAVIPGPFALHLTEPCNTVCQSWRDISVNSSHTGTSVPVQHVSESSSYMANTASGSTSYLRKARMNHWKNSGHGNSIPQQEWGLLEGFPSGNSLIFDDDHDDDSFGCLQATFKGLRLIQQNLKQLVIRMMVPNEGRISCGHNVAVGRNPKVCRVCKTRVVGVSQIPCCHIVCQQCLPFNDGRCRVCKTPVEDLVAYDIYLQNVAL